MKRRQVLQKEFERNASSRQELCEKLLQPFLHTGMTVLDFGCGVGFLARSISPHVARVIAADVSRGVLACARQLNPAKNVSYVRNGLTDLRAVLDQSVDFIYSFAVFQHLRKEQSAGFAKEFARVLRPGGSGILHTILSDPSDGPTVWEQKSWVAQRVHVRMVYFSADELRALLQKAGLRAVKIARVRDIAEVDDDIGEQHVVMFEKPVDLPGQVRHA
jgi:cyclopropane fatty-acyl-phospholipid synthase-like methyltransferase